MLLFTIDINLKQSHLSTVNLFKGDESPPNAILQLALDITKSDEDAKSENIPKYITVLMKSQHLLMVDIYVSLDGKDTWNCKNLKSLCDQGIIPKRDEVREDETMRWTGRRQLDRRD